MKTCRRCGSTEFYAGNKCKPCHAKSATQWAIDNPEKDLARRVAYKASNKEKIKAAVAAHYAANREKLIAKAAKYRAEHPNKAKATKDKYRAANPGAGTANGRAWRAANPESVRASQHLRRARKLEAGGSFSPTDIKKLLSLQKCKCAVCSVDVSKNYHIDHIMPLALGGYNGPPNLQILCRTCNQKKHCKHPVDFMQEKGFLL